MLLAIWPLWKFYRWVPLIETIQTYLYPRNSDYCKTGCQSDFGTCSPTTTQPSGDDFICGPTNGGKMCASGICCIQNGYFGNTTDYCDAGCQSAYGTCDPNAPPAQGGTCGPNFGGTTCSDNRCCSVAGKSYLLEHNFLISLACEFFSP
jgi:hypothetical protein